MEEGSQLADRITDALRGRIPEQLAGYMELQGAQKDADCKVVEVQGGISSKLGCCNNFDPQDGAQVFSCGTCDFVTQGEPNVTLHEPSDGQTP